MRTTQPDRLDTALRKLIAVILLGGMLGILSSTMAVVAIDTLATTFDASLSAVGWVSTGFLLAVTAAIPLTTWAVDRVGSKRMWLFGLLLFSAGSLASGLAWDVPSLVVFRVVQGFGAGILDPLVLTLLARAAGPSRAGRVMGLMGVVLSLGPVLGPISGGLVLDALQWRWMFLLNVPVAAVALLLAIRIVPSDPPAADRSHTRLDVVGLALLSPSFAALVLALSQSAERGQFASAPVLLFLALGVLLLAGYGWHALRVRAVPPLIDLRLFTQPAFAASVAVMTLVGLATFASLFVLPLYYQQLHGHGVLAAGLLVTPVGVGAAISMPIAGRVSDHIGARTLVRAGAVLSLFSCVAFTQAGPGTSELWTSALALSLGLGLGGVGAPTMGSLYRTLPAALVPQGSSVLYMLNQLGAAVGIAVVTFLVETAGTAVDGFHLVYWFAVGTIVIILAATAWLPGRRATRLPVSLR